MSYADSLTERIIASSGYHPAGPWWIRTIDHFDQSGARVLVARVGRRGGKSVHALRWAAREILEKQWPIDRGDVGVLVAHYRTSINKKKARLVVMPAGLWLWMVMATDDAIAFPH
jgi:hypothetical protein